MRDSPTPILRAAICGIVVPVPVQYQYHRCVAAAKSCSYRLARTRCGGRTGHTRPLQAGGEGSYWIWHSPSGGFVRRGIQSRRTELRFERLVLWWFGGHKSQPSPVEPDSPASGASWRQTDDGKCIRTRCGTGKRGGGHLNLLEGGDQFMLSVTF